MERRGQVTIFIVLGIIVLVVFGLLLSLRTDFVDNLFDSASGSQFESVDIEAVKDSISYCVEGSLVDAVTHISNRGGYFSPMDSSFYSRDVHGVLVTYAWTSDYGTRLPSLTGLGQQIKLYMDEASNRELIEDCIDGQLEMYRGSWDFNNVNDFEFRIPRVSANSIKQEIIYPSDSPLSVKGSSGVATTTEILAELDVALGQAQKVADEIIDCFGGSSNDYCNQDGIPFRMSIYNLFNYRNVISMNEGPCDDACLECYILEIPVDGGDDILFNVNLKTC
jgi:hypothetical protein